MKKRLMWLVLLIFAVSVGIMACGGTLSDVSENPEQQVEKSEKQGIGITFLDPHPDYSHNPECASRQRALVENESLSENEYLVTGENQITDAKGSLTIDELQRKFEETLTSSDDLNGETGVESDKSISENVSRNFEPIIVCPLNIFCVLIRGMDYHELRPCVYEMVHHVNIELMKNKNDPRTKYWMNLHVGAYRNKAGKLCFVIFEQVEKSKNMRFCKEICGPSRKDLEKALNQAITTVLASAGIVVSAYAVSAAAATLSSLIFSVLVAL